MWHKQYDQQHFILLILPHLYYPSYKCSKKYPKISYHLFLQYPFLLENKKSWWKIDVTKCMVFLEEETYNNFLKILDNYILRNSLK